MTSERDIERVLDRWLAEQPVRVADRVLDGVADRIGRQPQQPAWRVSWRGIAVNGTTKSLAAMAAVIVVAVVGVALVVRPSGPNVGGIAPPSSSPSSSASLAPSPTPAWKAGDIGTECGDSGPLGGCAGPLTAGTYTSSGLQPPVTYTLTTPWVNAGDWDAYFQLYPDEPQHRATMAQGGYPPYILIMPRPKISPSACAGDTTPNSDEVDAAGFAEYVASREGIAVTEPIPVTVSGLSGLQVDVTFEPAWTGCFRDMPSDAFPGRPNGIRYIILDDPDDGSLMISLVSPPTDFDRFVGAAMAVVESFRFDLGDEPSPSPS
jgi:hypothetical protein